jgi:hypothetical protein
MLILLLSLFFKTIASKNFITISNKNDFFKVSVMSIQNIIYVGFYYDFNLSIYYLIL